MPTEVVMPQMGESIAEGTIVRWMKKVGDAVARDEPLFEISTDKVDAEIPAPAAGVLAEIRVHEGATVPVNSVVAVIGDAVGAVPSQKPSAPEAQVPPSPAAPSAASGDSVASVSSRKATEPATTPAPPQHSLQERIHQHSSPLVRNIAKAHDIDITQIHGTGIAGRVTKDDILAFIERRDAAKAAPVRAAGTPAKAPSSVAAPGDVQPMSVMRKRIAEHMLLSRKTSAHVHSVFEINFFRVAQIRESKKAEYERAGAKLTYLSFIIKAAVAALGEVPVVNASIDGENVVYHRDANVGIAVALDRGLIVPVIQKAGERSLLELSREIGDLAARARSKQLKPEEVAGGTFTITNPGVFGALFGMPIINQPQVAILGVGYIEKRPVVIDDAIAIRPMAYLTLGYDHRLIDGAVADQFMSHVKHTIENWDPNDA